MRRRITNLKSFRLLMALVPAVAAAADVHTVDDDDPAADFATIQAAVDIAVDGDSILVGPGYYFIAGSEDVPVVEVVGKSIEILATSDDPARTVISGQGSRRCVSWFGGAGGSRLEGFTINGGFVSGDGAGLQMDQASLAIIDCIFSGNLATGDGGAIHSRSEAPFPPVVVGCRFESNSANAGGATWADRGLDLVDCVFQSNSAVVDGGGSYFSRNPMGDGAFSIIHECRYLACDAMFGGGIRGSDATLRVSESTFSGCVGGDEFRPIGWGGGISMVDARLEVSDSTFSGCIGGRNGGAIDADDSEVEASNCAFTGCSSIDYAGAVNGYGPLTTLAFDGCSFTGNVVYEGTAGAIGCAEFSSATHAIELRVVECIFEDNLGFIDASCIDAGNVVSAIDCEFGEQDPPQIPGSGVKVAIRGIGSGSLFEGCSFTDGLSLDGPSAFRASTVGSLAFVGCRFADNETIVKGDQLAAAGAVSIGASPDSPEEISFADCEFTGNGICCLGGDFFAGNGGALRVTGRRVLLESCRFDGNSASEGGSLVATATMINCSISGLVSLGYGGAASLGAGSSMTNCRIGGSADCNIPLVLARGPIEVDRCTFVGGIPENFGCNEDPAELAASRFAEGTTVRHSRFCGYDPAAIVGTWTDLGGNSFNPDACVLADIGGDGAVDGADLAIILADWGQPCLGCPSDINDDGFVDGADLALVLAGWG